MSENEIRHSKWQNNLMGYSYKVLTVTCSF